MGGGLIQLITKGAQDIYLIGNPQITFFKVVYRRYTNFSMELKPQTITGFVKPGNNVKCYIQRDGDLIHNIYVELENNTQEHYPSNFGNYMLDQVDILIGGQVIDSQSGHWMEVYSRLTQHHDAYPMSDRMDGIDYGGGTDRTNQQLYDNYQRLTLSGGIREPIQLMILQK